MRVFLDVGAHDGQTLTEALKPEWGFDKLYAFEPMRVQYQHLCDRFDDPRLELRNYGLADATGQRLVYGSNEIMEASIFADKDDADAHISAECYFVEASEFFRGFAPDDTLIVKLNCEGAEVIILHNLIDSGQIWKIDAVMIDFDVRKIPSQAHTEAEMMTRLAAIGFDRFALCSDVMIGETHQLRIANWLGGL